VSQRFLPPVNGDAVLVVDATDGNEAVTLPKGYATQRRVLVRRLDASANTVTVGVITGGVLNGATNGTTPIAALGEKQFTALDGDTWISTGGVTASSVGTGEIADGAIGTADIASGAVTKAKIANDIATHSALTSTYVQKVTAPTGVAATDTAAIIAAHDALPAAGGEIRLQPGRYVVTADAITFTKAVHLVGCGGSMQSKADGTPNAATVIECSSATGVAINVTMDGANFTDLAVINTSAGVPTAGAGIKFSAGSGRWTRLRGVSIVKFWNNLQYDAGFYYQISDSTFLDAANYGCYFRNTTALEGDHGDQGIVNSVITQLFTTRVGAAGIRWESGGGLRVVGCKINGGTQPGNSSAGRYTQPIRLAPTGTATGSFIIVGNSIENPGDMCVEIQPTDNTSQVGRIVITGNQFGGYGGQGGVAVRGYTDGSAPLYTNNVMIANNTFDTCGIGIYLKNCTRITVGTNQFRNVTSGVIVEAGMTDYHVVPQHFTQDGLIIRDMPTAATNAHIAANVQHAYQREIPSTTSSSTYTTLYRVVVPAYGAGVLDIDYSGVVVGKGEFIASLRRIYSRGASGVVTLATVGTDATAGNVVDTNLDVAATAGEIKVQIRLNSVAGGTDIVGRCTIRVNGQVYELRRGA
jgi:parallel beta-helix repeat protein